MVDGENYCVSSRFTLVPCTSMGMHCVFFYVCFCFLFIVMFCKQQGKESHDIEYFSIIFTHLVIGYLLKYLNGLPLLW